METEIRVVPVGDTDDQSVKPDGMTEQNLRTMYFTSSRAAKYFEPFFLYNHTCFNIGNGCYGNYHRFSAVREFGA
jgi:hypothetical protein